MTRLELVFTMFLAALAWCSGAAGFPEVALAWVFAIGFWLYFGVYKAR